VAKKQKEEEVPSDAFTVMMTALSIILLAFFIVMNAIAVVDDERSRKAIGSLIGSFGILPGGLRSEKSKGKSITPTSIPLVKPKDELSILLKILQGPSPKEEEGGSLGLYGTKEGLVIALGEKIAFDSGSAEIKKKAVPLLKRIAHTLARFKNNIYVEGHTDNMPIHSGKFRSNWELSTSRAVNTLRFLAGEGGVPGERLAAIGYGSSRPLVRNDTARHKAMNRRVEIIIAKQRGGKISF